MYLIKSSSPILPRGIRPLRWTLLYFAVFEMARLRTRLTRIGPGYWSTWVDAQRNLRDVTARRPHFDSSLEAFLYNNDANLNCSSGDEAFNFAVPLATGPGFDPLKSFPKASLRNNPAGLSCSVQHESFNFPVSLATYHEDPNLPTSTERAMEPPDESLALLARLSAKPGVQSTLVLSRVDGAIVRSTGLLARKSGRPGSSDSSFGSSNQSIGAVGDQNGANGDREGEDSTSGAAPASGDEVAGVVWRFVQAAGDLVEELDGDDELKLLRVRTKKNELVVVPSRFCHVFI
jgi:dynein light chain roadblock-type